MGKSPIPCGFGDYTCVDAGLARKGSVSGGESGGFCDEDTPSVFQHIKLLEYIRGLRLLRVRPLPFLEHLPCLLNLGQRRCGETDGANFLLA